MTPKFWARAGGVGLLALLVLPSLAFATDNAASEFAIDESTGINTMWVVLAAMLVMFMQAGFLLLEIGFSRGKNAGTIVAKVLTNFSIAALGFWAVGFALAFGVEKQGLGGLFGTDGFFLRDFGGHASPTRLCSPPTDSRRRSRSWASST